MGFGRWRVFEFEFLLARVFELQVSFGGGEHQDVAALMFGDDGFDGRRDFDLAAAAFGFDFEADGDAADFAGQFGGADDFGEFFVQLCGKAACVDGFEGLVKVCHFAYSLSLVWDWMVTRSTFASMPFSFSPARMVRRGSGRCFLRLFACDSEQIEYRSVGTVVAFFGFGFAFFTAFTLGHSWMDACAVGIR